jgi:hypothetical protein
MNRPAVPSAATVRRLYGAAPWTLPLLLACFAVCGYVASKVVGNPKAFRIAVWFVGAAVLHDLVLFPLYSAADRTWQGLTGVLPRLLHARGDGHAVPVVNHVRVPAAFSLLMLLVYAPTVFGRGTATYRAASGLGSTAYLLRWGLLTLAFFAISAVVYLIRWALAARRAPADPA